MLTEASARGRDNFIWVEEWEQGQCPQNAEARVSRAELPDTWAPERILPLDGKLLLTWLFSL